MTVSLKTWLLPLAAAVFLGGCGFQPMDRRTADADTSPALAAVEIPPIPDRMGQVMRTGLARRLNPTSTVVPHKYTLKVTYTTTTVARSIRPDTSAIREDVTVTASFTLSLMPQSEEQPGKTLLIGSATAVTQHDNPEQLYAGFVSLNEARERASDLAAEDIARQVRLYFRYPDRYPPPAEPQPEAPRVPTERPTRP